MAKAKDRPAAATRERPAAAKSGGARTPGSRPTQARKPARAAPDTPQVRDGEVIDPFVSDPILNPMQPAAVADEGVRE